MKKRASDNVWIPFWVDKWIFGSMRIELTLEERAVWIDMLALAAKDNGYIRANEETAYPLEQLAGMLIIPKKILEKSIETFIKKGKIRRYKNGVLYIITWEKYQFSERYRRMFKGSSSSKEEGCSAKSATISYKDCISKKDIKTNHINNMSEKTKKFFEILWKDWPKEGRFLHKYCFIKFKALVKAGKLDEFRQTTIGYFEYRKYRKLNENFNQQVLHLKTWMNNWEGEKKTYMGFEYKPKL